MVADLESGNWISIPSSTARHSTIWMVIMFWRLVTLVTVAVVGAIVKARMRAKTMTDVPLAFGLG